MLPYPSYALYPPTRPSKTQTPVYMRLQPIECSFHPSKLGSSLYHLPTITVRWPLTNMVLYAAPTFLFVWD